jgi:DNA-binding MarR family transcriptional regulator
MSSQPTQGPFFEALPKSRLIARLADRGLIERCINPNDRRANRLLLTPRGASCSASSAVVTHERLPRAITEPPD